MSRFERTIYFERLIEMRASYARRPDDNRGILLIEDALIYAEAVMLAYEVEEALAAEDAALDAAAHEAASVDAAALAAAARAATATPDGEVPADPHPGTPRLEPRSTDRIGRLTRFFDAADRRPGPHAA